MIIIPNQDFKHGLKTYLKDESYDVSPEEAAYFLWAGWVGDKAEPKEHSLDIQNGQLGHSSEVN